MVFKIKSIKFEDEGKKIVYDYEYDVGIAKYFNKSESFFVAYDVDVSDTPLSIAIIPFLSNLVTIAWFVDFIIEIDEIDETFLHAIEIIKKEFKSAYPKLELNKDFIVYKNKIKNSYKTQSSAMLFSGGVDAYATYFRNFKKKLDLITIHGADVEINDTDQWNRIITLNSKEKILNHNEKHYIKSNLRAFYTYNVDMLLPNLGWWGSVQHGLALNGVVAPLAQKKGYENIFIASSYTDNIKITWGSTPEIDNNISWASTRVIHDGYELKRQDKLSFIVNFLKNNELEVKLRVCYSLLNKNVNCSKCEKCHRTILGIIVANANPNNYGFSVTEKIYDEVLEKYKNGFNSEGVNYFWWEILQIIKNEDLFFVFRDLESEKMKMNEIKKMIHCNLEKKVKKKTYFEKIKFKIQNKLPRLFKIYLKIRQKGL
ncbi:hypothetical protein [Flavobacterium sp.]|uniref:hypothetical protein n=1 Tax=Flavobacterium sp. TaxID=239 RepID=UPI0025BDC294|nr:hypothetical protein [Flavobacterium sp.]